MRKLCLLSTLVLTVLACSTVSAQDFSNKGKDFWLCFPSHVPSGNLAEMSLFITSDRNSAGVVTYNGITTPFTVTANAVTEVPIVRANAYISDAESGTPVNKGIRVRVNTGQPAIVVYSHIYAGFRTAATLVLPVNVLGKRYRAMSYFQAGTGPSKSQYQVIAVEPNTDVKITPFLNGSPVGAPFTVNLPNVGDVYQVQNDLDVTGTHIESIAVGAGTCKKIAVFSGSSALQISRTGPPGGNCTGGSFDPLNQQCYPVSSWGKNFGVIPIVNNNNGYHARVTASEDNTTVNYNGVIVLLNAGQTYPSPTLFVTAQTTPIFISADKPIACAQFLMSQNCASPPPVVGDPDMIILNPIEQNIRNVTLFTSTKQAILQQHMNVLIQTVAVPSFRINGAPVGGWVTMPSNPAYSYLRYTFAVGQNSYTLTADSGFNVINYGLGNAESYGYSGGTNVRDLYQQIGIISQWGIETEPYVCTNAPFKFKVSLPYCADSIHWDLSNLPVPPVPPIIKMNYTNCVAGSPGGPDSITVINGKNIFWYSLPATYTIGTTGIYPINITVFAPNPDGCGNEQEIDFDLNVSTPPVADFSFTTPGCFTETVQFTETTTQIPKPTYRFWWEFGDPASGAQNNSTLRNPTHLFTGPGPFTVRHTSITTPGCLTDTIQEIITIPDLPTGTIDGTTTVCLNAPSPTITFTASGGTAPYTFTYNINGGPPLTVGTTSGNSVTITVPTGVAGVYNYNLVSVQNTGSALCIQSQTGTATVTVNPLPTATITGATQVCLNDPAPNVTFTGALGTAPYTFTYNINGGPNQTVTTVSGNSVTVAAPTNVAGTFVYNLVSVAEGSPLGCNQPQTGSVTITVNPLPTATIDGTIAVCLNAPQPNITFTGASGTAPYTFTYNINGGPNQIVTTVSGNSVTVAAPTNVAGTFVYNLLNVADGSSTSCSQPQTGSATVTVIPAPTATISGTISVCLNAPSPDVTFTGANGTAPYIFTYNINGGPPQTVSTVSGNSVNIPAPTNVAGTFVYNLVSVQESSGAACSQAQTGSVTVTVNVLPTATVTGATTVCRNAPSPNVTFTGFSGTAPYTFTYNINGGPPQTVTTVAGNSVTVAAPTNVAGTFVYNLVSVQEGSGLACQQAQTGSTTIIVNELPTATIAGTTEVCLNGTSPLITFTGAGTTAPYTFTYNINGGPPQTVTTVAGNSVTVSVPTNVAGTFVYNLVSVSDGTPQVCGQAQTGSATVVVNQLPTAAFTASAPFCESTSITFTDASTPNSGAITSWTWDFGDGSPVVVVVAPNPPNQTHTYALPGVYTVSLVVTTDKGCTSINPPQQITVYSKPTADFQVPEVCLSDTWAQFNDLSTPVPPDVITNWNWDFGDGGTSTLQNPQHSYTAVGSYNVTLTVTTNRGCTDTKVLPIFVNGSFPVADFTVQNPSGLCANDSVSIVEASTVFPGTITKIEIYWDNVGAPGVFDTDNTPFSGKVYKHKYPTLTTTQTYTIRYRAYSGGVCVNDRFRDVTVNAAPDAVFNAMPSICYDAAPWQIPPAIASEIGGVAGTGVFTGPGVSSGGLFTPTAAGIGTHRIRYTFTSNMGCVDTASNLITVWDTATAVIDAQALMCERTPVSFNSSNSTIPPGNGTITGWSWNFGDPASGAQNTSTAAAPTHLFTGWGNYTVTLSVITSNGCRSTVKTLPVTVNAIARPNFTFPAVSCLPNANVQFTNNTTIPDGSAMTYYWDFGDPPSGTVNNSTATSPSHTYVGTGPYFVNLQVTSATGCVHDTTIRLASIHPQPQASFNTDVVDVCIGGSITFTNTSNPMDGTLQSLNWDLDNGQTRTVPSFTYTYPAVGTYDVTLYITNSWNCRSNTFTKTVSVNPFPPVNAGPNKFMLEGGQVQLTPAVNVSYPVTYSWSPGRYLDDSTLAMPIARPPDDMYFRLTVTSDKGCSAWDTMFVKVLKKPDIPNIFSPNGDGINDRWEIKYLESYPNATVEVVNRYGQLVFRSEGYSKPWDGKINGADAPVGTYYYVVSPKNGRQPLTGYVDIIR